MCTIYLNSLHHYSFLNIMINVCICVSQQPQYNVAVTQLAVLNFVVYCCKSINNLSLLQIVNNLAAIL